MRVVGLYFFLMLIFQVCFTANAVDLSIFGVEEESSVTSFVSHQPVPHPVNENEDPSPIQNQGTMEDDEIEIWHEFHFFLAPLKFALLNDEIEKFHHGPYLSGLYRPPCRA